MEPSEGLPWQHLTVLTGQVLLCISHFTFFFYIRNLIVAFLPPDKLLYIGFVLGQSEEGRGNSRQLT